MLDSSISSYCNSALTLNGIAGTTRIRLVHLEGFPSNIQTATCGGPARIRLINILGESEQLEYQIITDPMHR